MPHKKPIEFQLLTVTYRMSCAPFLALRVLRQLRQNEGDNFPLAAPVLDSNINVDDILFGADNLADPPTNARSADRTNASRRVRIKKVVQQRSDFPSGH